MTFHQQLALAQSFLSAYKIDEARAVLHSVVGGSPIEERMRLQFLARASMREGKMLDALALLNEAIERFGSHILAKADRLSCLYHLGNKIAWRSALMDYQSELETCRDRLTIKTRYRADEFLGKFLEEEGEVAESLKVYESLGAVLTESEASERIFIRAQVLRLRASFGQPGLEDLYRDLIGVRVTNAELYASFEIQHALMLAEFTLSGPQKAWRRYYAVVHVVPPQDQKLLVFDFIEACLRGGHAISHDVLEMARTGSLDTYEKALLDIAERRASASASVSAAATETWSPEMSFASYLRLLSLVASRETSAELGALIETLSRPSRAMWRNVLRDRSTAATFEFDTAAARVTFNSQSISLASKQTLVKLLSALITAPSTEGCRLEDLTRALWQTDYDSVSHNRLRVLSQRLDSTLREVSGLPRVLAFSADGLRLDAGVHFTAK